MAAQVVLERRRVPVFDQLSAHQSPLLLVPDQGRVPPFHTHGVISLIRAQVNPTRVVAVGPKPDIEPL